MPSKRTNVVFDTQTNADLDEIRCKLEFRYGRGATSLHTRAAIHYLAVQNPAVTLQAMDDYLRETA
jgi:hypothetical protein